MLALLNKKIQKFKLRYLLYIVLLNFFFSPSIIEFNYKSDSQVSIDELSTIGVDEFSTISVAENYSITNLLNVKKVERNSFEQSVEYKGIHYSRYFYVDSKYLPQRISVSYAKIIQDIITQYKLLNNHLDFRSPPSLTA